MEIEQSMSLDSVKSYVQPAMMIAMAIVGQYYFFTSARKFNLNRTFEWVRMNKGRLFAVYIYI